MKTRHFLHIRPIGDIIDVHPQYENMVEFSQPALEKLEKNLIWFYDEVAKSQQRLSFNRSTENSLTDYTFEINEKYSHLLKLNQSLILNDPPHDLFVFLQKWLKGPQREFSLILNMRTILTSGKNNKLSFWGGDMVEFYIYEIENVLNHEEIEISYYAFIARA